MIASQPPTLDAVEPVQQKRPRGQRGTPTKQTPTVEARLIDAISQGCTLRLACGFAGISYETFRTWMRAAEDDDERYVELYRIVERAKADGAMRHLGNIDNAGTSDWRASAWILEHRYPDEYGSKQRTEVSGPSGGPIEVNNAALSEAALELTAWRETMAVALSSLQSVPPTLPTSPTNTE